MIFLDSSFLIGYKIENDHHHERALKIMKDISSGTYGEAVFSDYVFDETLTVVFGKSKILQEAVSLGDQLLSSALLLRVDESVFQETFDLFREQKTKLSFTDCSIVALMRSHGVKRVATFDEEFQKVEGIEVVA
ncbi:hypothetical protein CMI48_02155 [Candidatus Pacearchaeota archaeon]|nr:hypothetical protein [Candidatus Pacearchaeota archaeon]